PTKPATSQFAVQPAAQAQSRYYSIAPDCRIWAHSLMFLQHDKDGHVDEDGRYVALTQTDTTKTWRWRLGNSPSLAFSPEKASDGELPRRHRQVFVVSVWVRATYRPSSSTCPSLSCCKNMSECAQIRQSGAME